MKVIIAFQLAILGILVAFWTALAFGLEIPPANMAQVLAGKDVLLTLLSLGSLTTMFQKANEKILADSSVTTTQTQQETKTITGDPADVEKGQTK